MTLDLDHGAGPVADPLIDALLDATRAERSAARQTEFCAAVLGSLLDRYGARYLERATADLEQAIGELVEAGDTRRSIVERLAPQLKVSPQATLAAIIDQVDEPYSSMLAELRSEMLSVRDRLVQLASENTAALGQRMALVTEALGEVGSESNLTYGRNHPSKARLLRGVL